jgi:predicted ATP-grasp superfamily ATP-dependent carboligase
MKLFLYEHITGGGLCGEPLPTSLAMEGRAMLTSLCQDLDQIEGVSVSILWDERLRPPDVPAAIRRLTTKTSEQVRSSFDRMLEEADATCVIAPELGGQLYTLAQGVTQRGRCLLGSTPIGIELASDKWLLPRHLALHGIKAVPAMPFSDEILLREGLGERSFVVKPRRGAGSTDVFVISTDADLAALPGFSQEMIATPWMDGVPASVLLLVNPSGAPLPLLPSRQRLSRDGRLKYLGGALPLDDEFAERATRLAERAVQAIPGLRGFVGVDLLLATRESAGSQTPQEDVVVEVNARVTTSYVGLRALARDNLARLWLDTMTGCEPPAPSWDTRAVEFFPDGRVETLVP